MKIHDEYPFDYDRWRKNAAANGRRPPYFDCSDGGREQRVFVCSDWFPRWEDWRVQAAAAADAALCGTSPITGQRFLRSDAPPLASEPPYLIDEACRIWLNVRLAEQGQAAFEAAFAAASVIRDERRQWIRESGFCPIPAPQPRYDPMDHDAGELWNLFRDIR